MNKNQRYIPDKNNVPKLWIESLDVDPSFMEDLLKQDNKIMYSYGLAVAAISTRSNPSCLAKSIASLADITPNCSPVEEIILNSFPLIFSFTLILSVIIQHLQLLY